MKKLLIVIVARIGGPLFAAAPATTGLKAGAATSNLMPELGARIVGGFAPYPAEHVHDELHARCLVLDDGRTRVALVVCDLLGLHRVVSIEARRLIQEATGIPPSNVMIFGDAHPLYSAYSLHYVGGVGSRHISADFYGMYCEALKKLQKSSPGDPPFVALMANGTSGDGNNSNFRQPRQRKPNYEQMREVAEDVAVKVNAALANVKGQDSAEISARFREADIAWRPISAELLAWAKDIETRAPRVPRHGEVGVGKTKRIVKPSAAIHLGSLAFIATARCVKFAPRGLA